MALGHILTPADGTPRRAKCGSWYAERTAVVLFPKLLTERRGRRLISGETFLPARFSARGLFCFGSARIKRIALSEYPDEYLDEWVDE